MNVENIKMPYEVRNIVANGKIKLEDDDKEITLDMYGLALEIEDVMYEPEQFPGAVVKLNEYGTTFLIFKNCKFICTGGETEEDVENSIAQMKDKLKQYLEESN